MTVTDIENIFLTQHRDCLKNISDISKDTTNGKILCNYNTKLFFCFDDIVRKLYNTQSFMPASPDMILFNKAKNLIILVEFKNGKVETQNVRLKFLESFLFIFPKILNIPCNEVLNNIPIAYLLIYNYDRNSDGQKTIEQITKDINSMPTRFGIDILKNKCIASLKSLHTHPCHHSIYNKLTPYGYQP